MEEKNTEMIIVGGMKFRNLLGNVLTLSSMEFGFRDSPNKEIEFKLEVNEDQERFISSQELEDQFLDVTFMYTGNEFDQARNMLVVNGSLKNVSLGEGFTPSMAILPAIYLASDIATEEKARFTTSTVPLNLKDEVEWISLYFGDKTYNQAVKMKLRKGSFVSMVGKLKVAENTMNKTKAFISVEVSNVDFIRR